MRIHERMRRGRYKRKIKDGKDVVKEKHSGENGEKGRGRKGRDGGKKKKGTEADGED